MKLSVLIPTYNYAQYLPKALQSVLEQDFTDFELIVSDDASTDLTEDIVRNFLEKDTRVRYVRHKNNLGMVNNWNWCLSQANGEYIYFLFADDYLLSPHALSDFVEALDRHQDAIMVASPRMVVNHSGEILWKAYDLGKGGYYSGKEAIAKCWIAVANLIGEPSVVMMRRLEVTRGFLTTFKQLVDLEMWMYCLVKGGVYFLEEPQVAFRQHELQQTAKNNTDQGTLLEMYRLRELYKEAFSPKNNTEVGKFENYQSIYRVWYDICRANSHSKDVLDAALSLKKEIPLLWWFSIIFTYRINKQAVTLRRSLRKRGFIR